MQQATREIQGSAGRFAEAFGRHRGDLLEGYRDEGAEVLLVSMGSLLGTMKEVVDELREEGHPVGIIKVRTVRPFPRNQLHDALHDARVVGVLEKDISLGLEGILCSEIRSAFCGESETPNISSFIVGLGGRDVRKQDIRDIALGLLSDDTCRVEMTGIDHEVVWSAHQIEDEPLSPLP
jgi:pyruvate ferredoxin oxidoreductase alpha subunit